MDRDNEEFKYPRVFEALDVGMTQCRWQQWSFEKLVIRSNIPLNYLERLEFLLEIKLIENPKLLYWFD